jgi:hypothetical protein
MYQIFTRVRAEAHLVQMQTTRSVHPRSICKDPVSFTRWPRLKDQITSSLLLRIRVTQTHPLFSYYHWLIVVVAQLSSSLSLMPKPSFFGHHFLYFSLFPTIPVRRFPSPSKNTTQLSSYCQLYPFIPPLIQTSRIFHSFLLHYPARFNATPFCVRSLIIVGQVTPRTLTVSHLYTAMYTHIGPANYIPRSPLQVRPKASQKKSSSKSFYFLFVLSLTRLLTTSICS